MEQVPYTNPDAEEVVPYALPKSVEVSKPVLNPESAKQTAYMGAALAPGGDPFAHYTAIKNELQAGGQSETLNTVNDFLMNTKNDELRQVFNEKLLDPSLSVQSLTDYAKVVVQLQKENLTGVPDLRKHFAKRLAELPVANQTKAEGQVRKSLLNNLNAEFSARAQIEQLVAGKVGKVAGGAGVLENLGEVAETFIVPFYDNYQHAKVWENITETKAGVKRAMTTGSLREELRRRIHSLPPEERVEFARRTIQGFQALPGIFQADNGYQTHLMLTDMFVSEDADPESINWDKWLYNATGIIDLWAAGDLLKSGYKGVRKLLGQQTVAEIIAEANPAAGVKIFKELAKDTEGETSVALGASAQQMAATHGYPKTPLDRMNAGPDLAQATEKERMAAQLVEDTDAFGYLFKPEEKVAAAEKAMKQVQQAKGAVFNTSKTTIERAVVQGEDKLTINAGFTMTEHHGFPTAAEARDAALKNGWNENVITVLKRDYATGEYHPITAMDAPTERTFVLTADELESFGNDWQDFKKAVPGVKLVDEVLTVPPDAMKEYEKEIARLNAGGRNYDFTTKVDTNSDLGEFMFTVKDSRPYQADEALRLVTGEVTARNVITRTALPPSSKFSQFIAETAGRAQDVSKSVQGTMMKLVKDDWFALDDSEKLLLNKMLRDGEQMEDAVTKRKGVRFNETDIKIKYPDATKNTIAAYRSAGVLADTMWTLTNRRLYRDMVRRGVVTFTKDDFFSAGIRHPRSNYHEALAKKGGVVEAYDPISKDVKKLSSDEVDRLYARGGTLAELEEEGFIGKSAFKTVIVDEQAGLKVGALPQNVLNYVPGYYPRVYDKPYIIRKVLPNGRIVNGSPVDFYKTVATAETKSRADDFAARLTAEADDGARYEVYHDSSIRNKAERYKADEEALRADGRMFYSRRGDPLLAVEDDVNTLDPMEAFQRGVGVVSNQVALEPYVEAMKVRFRKTYGEFLPPNPERLSNEQVYQHLSDKALVTSPIAGEARTLWQYISLMDGADDEFAAAWRGWMMHTGEWLDGIANPVAKTMGKWVVEGRDASNIIQVSKTLGNVLFISGNPIKQRFLQALQSTFLAPMNPTYYFGKMQTDHKSLILGIATRDNPSLWPQSRAMIAKLLGTKEDEAEKLVDGFRASGFIESVDSHIFVAGSLQAEDLKIANTRMGRVANHVITKSKLPLRLAKRYGFDSGEISQLASTWLMAIEDFKKANPKVDIWSKPAQHAINAKTRAWSLAMNKAGMTRYQRGAFSAVTQFMAVQQKALFAMLPEAMGGSKTFTPTQKRKIAVGQFLLYGVSGLGVREVWEHARDEMGVVQDATLDEFMVGGLGDLAVNSIVGYAADADTDLSIASDFAPASGSLEMPYEMVRQVMEGNNYVLAGASGAAYSRLSEVASLAAAVIQEENLDTPEKALRTMLVAPEVFSGYNNYVKGKAMLKYGQLVEASGRLAPVAVEAHEAMAKQFFGIRTFAEHDYYDAAGDLKNEKKHLDEAADEYVRRISQVAVRFESEGNYDYDRYKQALTREAELFRVLDPWAASYVRERVRDSIYNDDGPRLDSFVEKLVKLVYKGGINDMEYMRTRVANWEGLTDEQRKQALEALDYALTPNETYKQAEQ